MKKFTLSLLTVLSLVVSLVTPTMASEKENSAFDLPEDAVILYQDENAVMYQSKTEAADTERSMRTPVDYESEWVDRNASGDFPIYNSRSGEMGVTWKVESSSNASHARIWMTLPGGLPFLSTRYIYPSNGDVYFRTNGVVGQYTVHYFAYTDVGMRIMCWMYD